MSKWQVGISVIERRWLVVAVRCRRRSFRRWSQRRCSRFRSVTSPFCCTPFAVSLQLFLDGLLQDVRVVLLLHHRGNVGRAVDEELPEQLCRLLFVEFSNALDEELGRIGEVGRAASHCETTHAIFSGTTPVGSPGPKDRGVSRMTNTKR